MPWIDKIIPSAIALMVGVIVGRGLPSDPASQNVTWRFPGGSLTMHVKKDLSNPEVMLKRVFEEDFSRAGALHWLREKYRIFALEDLSLIEAIEELCPDIPNEPFEARQRRLEGCTKIPVVERLRLLAENRRPPFQYIGREVRIGVPEKEEHRPKDGHANVCRTKGYLGRKIELTNPANRNSIVVKATGSYPCTGFAKFPDLQLNPQDARAMFDRPLQEYETAIAVVLFD